MLRISNWMSLPKIIIPSGDPDICEECGRYPKNVENGVKHPYCSRTCAKRRVYTKPALSAQSQRVPTNSVNHSKDRCEECGLYPKAVERGYQHPFCSKTCAQNSQSRLPTNVQNGCGQYPRAVEGGLRYTYCAASQAVGGFSSVAHANEFSRPRHISLKNDLIADTCRIQSSISPIRNLGVPGGSRRPRILFYHKHNPHYGFANFSYHPVVYKGKTYPTSEHLFQSFKFQKFRPEIAEHIRTYSDKPSVAFSEARQYQDEVRSDWNQMKIEKMDITLWHKFTQHPDLKAELLATGDAELVEDSDKDGFWGVGPDGRGRNELGKALERLRVELRAA